MRYRIEQIKLNPEKLTDELRLKKLRAQVEKRVADKIPGRKSSFNVRNLEIIRESIDARRKPEVKLVYTVDFDCDEKLPFAKGGRREYVSLAGAVDYKGFRPVIAGFGPCGIFAALILAEAGLMPIVMERGKAMDERVADVERFWKSAEKEGPDCEAPNPESNVQFGEGGAGTFSDGKLTTGIKDVRTSKVLNEFVAAGADREILYKQKPHVGTDRLRNVVKNLRTHIESLGGEVRFGTRLDGLEFKDDRLSAVLTGGERIETDSLILAIGHSASDTFEMLHKEGFAIRQKPFSIGIRVEHPQTAINSAQYMDAALADIIGPAEYKLSHRCNNGRGVYTFCMCPGGQVVNASTEAGTSVTNGMSYSARDGKAANSALLVDVRCEDLVYAALSEGYDADYPLAGFLFQRKYERLAWENRTSGGMVRTTYGEFKRDPDNPARKSLPDFVSDGILEAMPVFGRKLKGFDSDKTVITGVESRSSSPVIMERDGSLEALPGVIPAGEGPGYAGGIMSAAVDGIRAAEAVIRRKVGTNSR